MKEIRFRAWYQGEMCKVHSIHTGTKKVIVSDNMGNISLRFEDVELMQYTGLKDKNGKEIYEKDIIEAEEECGIVEWDSDELEYILTVGNIDFKLGTYLSREIAVVGNVYEDPNFFTMRANGMCCDCLNPISYHICGDYSENKWCKSRKEDGSCWE